MTTLAQFQAAVANSPISQRPLTRAEAAFGVDYPIAALATALVASYTGQRPLTEAQKDYALQYITANP